MDLTKSELFYKLKNMIDPEYKKKDFTFYIHKIKKIAPLSFELLGEEFFVKTLPQYFSEVVINEENLTENIYYFPLFARKYQAKLDIKDYAVELLDYEFTKFQIEIDPTPVQLSLYSQTTADVYTNPLAQAIRHEYDIHEFVLNFYKKPSKHLLPKKNSVLLLASKNPETNQVLFFKGNIHHAAMLDELHDGKISKKDLLQTLQSKYPNISQSIWVITLNELKSNFFILES